MPDLSLWAPDAWVASARAGAFRPLKIAVPLQRGADVYALQSALKVVFSPELEMDGVFGPLTRDAVRKYQEHSDATLKVDGIAGGVTQLDIAMRLAKAAGAAAALPKGVPDGHVQQESSGILGQYTILYTTGAAAGTRDQGVVQENSGLYIPAEAFSVPRALETLCKKVKDFHAKYVLWEVGDVRAWRLACGAWHQPSYTDLLAQGKALSSNPKTDADRKAHIERYIDLVAALAPSLN